MYIHTKINSINSTFGTYSSLFSQSITFFPPVCKRRGQIKLFSFGSTRLILTSDGQARGRAPSSWTSEILLVHFFFILLLNLFFDGFFRFYLLVFVQLNCIHPGGKRQFAGFRDHHGGHIGIAKQSTMG